MARLPEQLAWDNFSNTIPPWDLKAFRVENMCVDGMSDVIAINKIGTVMWIENKALKGWPARTATPVLADAFEPGQIPFLRQWKHWRGHGFVLLRVDKSFYLLDPDLELKSFTAAQIVEHAVAIGKSRINVYLASLGRPIDHD